MNDDAGAIEASRFKDLVFTLFSISNTPTVGDFVPWLKWVTHASGYVRYVKKVKATADAYLQEFLDVKKNNATVDDPDRNQDLVDVLLSQPSESNDGRLDDSAIKAVLQDLLLAGTDNSSITVEWGISELLRNPLALRKLQAELDSVVGTDRVVTETDLPNLPYLHAVVKETFRLHPTTPLNIPHESMEATNVWGYEFPAGTQMLVNFYAIHRDPKVWDRPEVFDPERFVDRASVDVRGNCYGLIPFSSGRRQCPGMHLGILFVQLGIARLVQAFEMAVPGKGEVDMEEIFGGTTPRKVPLAVVAKPRLAAELY